MDRLERLEVVQKTEIEMIKKKNKQKKKKKIMGIIKKKMI
jgi:hypothetical protein